MVTTIHYLAGFLCSSVVGYMCRLVIASSPGLPRLLIVASDKKPYAEKKLGSLGVRLSLSVVVSV